MTDQEQPSLPVTIIFTDGRERFAPKVTEWDLTDGILLLTQVKGYADIVLNWDHVKYIELGMTAS